MLEVQSNIKKINEARHANGKEEKVNKDDDPQLMGEAKTAMNDMFDMNVNSGDKLSLDDRVAMLNADQRHIFDGVNSHFLYQRQHEANECLTLNRFECLSVVSEVLVGHFSSKLSEH